MFTDGANDKCNIKQHSETDLLSFSHQIYIQLIILSFTSYFCAARLKKATCAVKSRGFLFYFVPLAARKIYKTSLLLLTCEVP